jgi:hypothetical protein
MGVDEKEQAQPSAAVGDGPACFSSPPPFSSASTFLIVYIPFLSAISQLLRQVLQHLRFLSPCGSFLNALHQLLHQVPHRLRFLSACSHITFSSDLCFRLRVFRILCRCACRCAFALSSGFGIF